MGFWAGGHMDRKLCMEIPANLRKNLLLASNEVLTPRKAACGLVNAAKEWFKRLKRELLARGFKSSTLDNCLYHLPKADGNGVGGVLGVHVDDLLGGGYETRTHHASCSSQAAHLRWT